MTYNSKLEGVISQAWGSNNLEETKELVIEHISNSSIKSKQTILTNLKEIRSKRRLDFYLANSLLAFEKLNVA